MGTVDSHNRTKKRPEIHPDQSPGVVVRVLLGDQQSPVNFLIPHTFTNAHQAPTTFQVIGYSKYKGPGVEGAWNLRRPGQWGWRLGSKGEQGLQGVREHSRGRVPQGVWVSLSLWGSPGILGQGSNLDF